MLFDLDGTLLETDFDELMPSYLQLVSERFVAWVDRTFSSSNSSLPPRRRWSAGIRT